ncbi:MAG: NAD(P)H-dependent oxidoreductase [Propionibacteriaceae bacterium]|nr:NAD(P)H-dependent oxidoreductase [Propionibacteriaceae bacterium]
MKVLLISGSLRQASLNKALLRAAAKLLPAGNESAFARLDDVPPYNEDLDTDTPPAAVQRLRDVIDQADAVVIATPEYNGAVTGVLKNALDWASRPHGASALSNKPVAIMAAVPSPNAALWARENLQRICAVIGAAALPQTVGIPAAPTVVVDDEIRDPELRAEVVELLDRLILAAANGY